MGNSIKYFTILNSKGLCKSVRYFINTDMIFIAVKEDKDSVEFKFNGYTQVIAIYNIQRVSEHSQIVKEIYK